MPLHNLQWVCGDKKFNWNGIGGRLEFLIEYGLFLAKVVTLVLAIVVVIVFILATGMKNSAGKDKGHISVTKINNRLDDMKDMLEEVVIDEKLLKERDKQEKKAEKLKQKQKKKNKGSNDEPDKKRVFVLDFDGDIKASETEELREAITAVLTIAQPKDEVVVKLESGGGMVHSYGLASSQLARITKKSIPLTVCVDKVAASGGYMMACVADKIVAAPFAIIGSIGVMAQLPNFHKVLKKHDVDYELYTAGEFKRTVTMFGENTEKGRQKFMEDLEDTHQLFKDFIVSHREQVDIETVATGEIWFGVRAIDQKLIDHIATSDEYITALHPEADIYEVTFEHKKTLQEKLGLSFAQAVEKTAISAFSKLRMPFWS